MIKGSKVEKVLSKCIGCDTMVLTSWPTRPVRCKLCKKKKYYAQSREFYKHNKQQLLDKQKIFANKHAKAIRIFHSQWRKNNTEHIKAYYKNKRSDPHFRIRSSLHNRVYAVMKGKRKAAKTLEMLGCSQPDLRLHLEQKFLPGMSWDNYGNGLDKWSIDHIIPCASFDLTKEEEQRKCFHYTNLQPLWCVENSRKGAKILP